MAFAMVEDQDFYQPRQAPVVTVGGLFGGSLERGRDPQRDGRGLNFGASSRHDSNVLRFYVL